MRMIASLAISLATALLLVGCSEFSTNYNLAFASYLLALLPMIIVYLIAQKWIIGNVTRGAVK
ncbi:hypothetical protein SAMN05421807_105191 [Virgibacillus chiguensis]|uniref:Uncharacterized protein n=1 Tax=Virgibacillus chiguensis TaxID=411959 RepID=A0A1M5RKT3_9BACI|nr:hypothetical protein SAMN05421807_105191 [Virgibacillus chiguensis]